MIGFDKVLEIGGKKLSDEQLAIVDSHVATIVSAGAGSGKTTVLSYRFIKLMMDQNVDADSILTLTFTKKAAAEMYERIYSIIGRLAENDDFFSRQLSVFPDAKICTMDSFWAEIARTGCIRYSIPRNFTVMENDELDDLLHRVFMRISSDAAYEEAMSILAERMNLEDIEGMLGRIAMGFTVLDSYDGDRQKELYSRCISVFLDYFMERTGEYIDSIGSFLEENGAFREKFLSEHQGNADCFESGDYDSLCKYSLPRAPKKDKAAYDVFKEMVESYRKCREALIGASLETEGIASSLKVIDLIAACLRAVNEEKISSGALVFSDVEAIAKRILIEDGNTRAYYKKRFRYIMVDEFQDNSTSQRDLLYLLSEKEELCLDRVPEPEELDPRKLFFVGDDKQSIYRFRGADVSVFNAMRDEVRRMGGNVLTLSTNYRTEPELVGFFNHAFRTMLEKEDSSEDREFSLITGQKESDYEASFTETKTRGKSEGIKPRIIVAGYEKPENDDGIAGYDEAEAEYISSLVRRMTDPGSGEFLVLDDDTRLPRTARLSDIKILFRTTASQMPIERSFRRHGIAYRVVESTSSTMEGVCYDLYSFLQLLVYPDDRLSYIALLRSPYARLSDQAILEAASAEGDAFSSMPSFSSTADEKSYLGLRGIYLEARSMVSRKPLSELLDYIFYQGGYYGFLSSQESLIPYIDHYEYLWTLASGFDRKGKGIVEYLDWIRSRLGVAMKMDSVSVQHIGTEGVELMTIHKSKGLEAKIVIIAGFSGGRNRNPSRIIDMDAGERILAIDTGVKGSNGKYAFPYAELFSKADSRRDNAEKKRLIYVAFTRAIDHLVMCVNESASVKGLYSIAKESMEGYEGLEKETIPPVAKDRGALASNPSDRLSWIEKAGIYPDPCYETRKVGLKESVHDGEEFVGTSFPVLPEIPADDAIRRHGLSADFGTLVHECLQAALEKREMPEYRNPAIPARDAKALMDSAYRIASAFLSSAFYRERVAGHGIRTEERFYFPMEGKVAEGSVDLLVFGDDCNLVVDYKTDLRKNPDYHKKQLVSYAQAMEELYGRECHAIVLYVRDFSTGPLWNSRGDVIET
ncbi:MAG: UvrD-helicase domain-containing protein [Candidatus Ornithospirochaeta sp.]|nr:UvrD-helicase domain-containing protein [Candidatus Ornithospirochaeta sp.]